LSFSRSARKKNSRSRVVRSSMLRVAVLVFIGVCSLTLIESHRSVERSRGLVPEI
jgi:hypothetical protein